MGRSIAVGIGGAGAWQALAWATDEADRSGARLVLFHVCASGSPLERPAGTLSPADVELIDPPLARAHARARTRLGGQRAGLRVHSGKPAVRLVDASAGVRLLVIGAGEGGRTARRVLRHAHCPVVVVRPRSRPDPGSPMADHVVIGVDGSAASRAAMEFGFGHANDHRLPLAAVYVTGNDVYPPVGNAADVLAAETEPWALKYPGVPLRRVVLHGPVVDSLIRICRGARLLVVGDKRRGVISRARTGDVPLVVAADAPCPVAVVPVDQREGDPL